MSDITSSQTIEQLKIIIATHGLPKKLDTDNGPSLVSKEFNEFMSCNGIVHITLLNEQFKLEVLFRIVCQDFFFNIGQFLILLQAGSTFANSF